MKSFILTVLASLFAVGQAAPTTSHVLHEKRSSTPRRWRRGERVHPDAILPIKIAFTQSNLDDGYDLLTDVRKSGKQWTAQQVHDYFSPAEGVLEDVREWLISSGIDPGSIVHYENRGWIALNISASKAEQLFQTEYFEYESETRQSDAVKVGCDEYHLPHYLANHVDYITPGIALSGDMIKRHVKRQWQTHQGPSFKPGPQRWQPPPNRQWYKPQGTDDLPLELQGCAMNITPTCLRALYGIPKATRSDSVNIVGIFETGDKYAQEDLNLFFQHYAPNVPQGTHPQLDSIDGGQAPVAPDSLDNGGESVFDLGIAYSLVYPQTVTLYQVDDEHYAFHDGFNNFLDALDGSYCNYTAYNLTGNFNYPGYDAVYPDTTPGGYNGTNMCGAYTPTRVINVSYNEAEYDYPWNYTRRQCNEYMKLGLQGVTVIFSSGDRGVGSYRTAFAPAGCLGNNQTVFNPHYPSCPYVLTVGATRLYDNQTVRDQESAMQATYEISPRFTSSGGFSNFFPAPDYQQSALSEYFSSHDPGYPSYVAGPQGDNIGANGGLYNRAGRGMPDVSANGANFMSYSNLTLYNWFGSSVAAPQWASMITLINEERTAAGKGSVGFINPTLYENSWIFNDIVNGSNPNCNSSGFHAVPGWDPVTGLGTPNYPKLLQVLSRLP